MIQDELSFQVNLDHVGWQFQWRIGLSSSEQIDRENLNQNKDGFSSLVVETVFCGTIKNVRFLQLGKKLLKIQLLVESAFVC